MNRGTKYALKTALPAAFAGGITSVILIGSNFSHSTRAAYVITAMLSVAVACAAVEFAVEKYEQSQSNSRLSL